MTNTFDRLPQILWEAARGKLPDDVLDQMADDKDAPRAAPDLAALQAENARLREALGQCVRMLDDLKAESGRGIDWGYEDAFRMGEWFDADDLAAIEAARAALGAEKPTEGETT